MAKLCDIQELESFSNIASAKLSVIYEKINALRIDGTISVAYSKDPYEQLEITVLKNDYRLFKMANLNKVPLQEREIKFVITCLEPELNLLVAGLDRREDYSNEQVFQRLINNEVVKPIFPLPKLENERNINAKYVKLDWLEDSLLTGIISPLDFVNHLKQRVFTLMQLDYLSENMKQIGFFFPLTTEEEIKGLPNLHANFKK